MIDLFSDVMILIAVLLNFMYILTCLLLYYCNKLTEDLFCLAEQRNNFLNKKVVFISIILYIYIYTFCIKKKSLFQKKTKYHKQVFSLCYIMFIIDILFLKPSCVNAQEHKIISFTPNIIYCRFTLCFKVLG